MKKQDFAIGMYNGVLWAYPGHNPINKISVTIGNRKLKPGTIVSQIGTKLDPFRYSSDMIFYGITTDDENQKVLLFKPFVQDYNRPSYICLYYLSSTVLAYGQKYKPIIINANDFIISKNTRPSVPGIDDFEQTDLFLDVM